MVVVASEPSAVAPSHLFPTFGVNELPVTPCRARSDMTNSITYRLLQITANVRQLIRVPSSKLPSVLLENLVHLLSMPNNPHWGTVSGLTFY